MVFMYVINPEVLKAIAHIIRETAIAHIGSGNATNNFNTQYNAPTNDERNIPARFLLRLNTFSVTYSARQSIIKFTANKMSAYTVKFHQILI